MKKKSEAPQKGAMARALRIFFVRSETTITIGMI